MRASWRRRRGRALGQPAPRRWRTRVDAERRSLRGGRRSAARSTSPAAWSARAGRTCCGSSASTRGGTRGRAAARSAGRGSGGGRVRRSAARCTSLGGQTPAGRLAARLRVRRAHATLVLRAPLPVPRYNAAAAALGGKLYVAGGVRGVDPVRNMFVFDARADRWRSAPPLPRRCRRVALVPFRNELWAIGGFDARGDTVRSVWIYSPRTERWRSGPRLAQAALRWSARRSARPHLRRVGARVRELPARPRAGGSAQRSRSRATRSVSSPRRAASGRSAAASYRSWRTRASSRRARSANPELLSFWPSSWRPWRRAAP